MRTPSTGNLAPHGSDEGPVESDKPRLPHERDESSESGAGAPSELIKQAHDDVASGKSNTDKGEATDAVYRRTLRDSTPGSERD